MLIDLTNASWLRFDFKPITDEYENEFQMHDQHSYQYLTISCALFEIDIAGLFKYELQIVFSQLLCLHFVFYILI